MGYPGAHDSISKPRHGNERLAGLLLYGFGPMPDQGPAPTQAHEVGTGAGAEAGCRRQESRPAAVPMPRLPAMLRCVCGRSLVTTAWPRIERAVASDRA